LKINCQGTVAILVVLRRRENSNGRTVKHGVFHPVLKPKGFFASVQVEGLQLRVTNPGRVAFIEQQIAFRFDNHFLGNSEVLSQGTRTVDSELFFNNGRQLELLKFFDIALGRIYGFKSTVVRELIGACYVFGTHESQCVLF